MYGIYANIWGILMGSMLPYIAYMDPMAIEIIWGCSIFSFDLLGFFVCGGQFRKIQSPVSPPIAHPLAEFHPLGQRFPYSNLPSGNLT